MQSLRRALWTARGVWSRRGLQQSAPHPFRRVPGAYRRSWARAAALTAAAAAVSGVAALSYWVDHANTPLFERYTWRARMEEAALSPDVAPAIHKGARRADAPLTRYTVADAVARVAPAVVNITVTLTTGDRWAFGPFFPQPSVAQSTGSGFIFDDREGLVLTNAHVVSEMRNTSQAAEMRVTLQDGRSFTGVVESVDALTDLAVPAHAGQHGHVRHCECGTSGELRARSADGGAQGGVHSDRRRHQHRQQRRSAGQPGRRGDRHQLAQGAQLGWHLLRAAHRCGQRGGGAAATTRPGGAAVPRVETDHPHAGFGRGAAATLGRRLPARRPPGRVRAAGVARRAGGPGRLRAGDVIVEFDGRPVRTTPATCLDLLGDNIQRPVPVVVLRARRPHASRCK
eukprot:ctg_487.g128